jgi:hypothetical protein
VTLARGVAKFILEDSATAARIVKESGVQLE